MVTSQEPLKTALSPNIRNQNSFRFLTIDYLCVKSPQSSAHNGSTLNGTKKADSD